MKAGRTIEAMLQELARQSAAKEDYLVNTSCLVMETDGSVPTLRMAGREEVQLSPLGIRPTAHQQIGTYLGIPAKYYGKMLAEDTELLAYNVNRWFQRNPEQRMLRTIDGHARAFLSNRYRRIDLPFPVWPSWMGPVWRAVRSPRTECTSKWSTPACRRR